MTKVGISISFKGSDYPKLKEVCDKYNMLYSGSFYLLAEIEVKDLRCGELIDGIEECGMNEPVIILKESLLGGDLPLLIYKSNDHNLTVGAIGYSRFLYRIAYVLTLLGGETDRKWPNWIKKKDNEIKLWDFALK